MSPFDENSVDEKEQRGDRVEENEDIQDDDQEREGVVAQGERARPLPQPRIPSSGRFRNTIWRTSLTEASVYIAYEEQGDPMRIADEQDRMRKKENNT